METANKSQSERLSEALAALRDDVTTDDRNACIKDLGVSQPTIWRYLNNQGTDNDTAVKLLTFFKKRIAKREEALSKA